MKLVDLETAKMHVHVTDPARDAEVTLYVELASARVMDYLGTRADTSWDETTAPDLVQAATLHQLGALYEHRGDDEDQEATLKAHNAMVMLLMNLRDIGLA
jgi:predicted HD phosphohydrolase